MFFLEKKNKEEKGFLMKTHPPGEDLFDLDPSGLTRSRRLPVLNECCEYTLPDPSLSFGPVLSALPRLLGLGLGFGLFFFVPPKLKNLSIQNMWVVNYIHLFTKWFSNEAVQWQAISHQRLQSICTKFWFKWIKIYSVHVTKTCVPYFFLETGWMAVASKFLYWSERRNRA